VAAVPELTNDEWTELVERLTHHAACKLARLTWRGLKLKRGGAVPGGVCPADLAAEAITDCIEGKRQWNQEAEPDFLSFLRSVVDSKVSHLAELLENRFTRRIAESKEGLPAYEVPDRAPDPAKVCLDKDALEKLRAAILKEIEGDTLVEGIFECLESEITKPADIAVVLGVDVKEVNNAQKRLRRKVEKVKNNLESR
jgi:hypothetical protein